MSPTTSSRLLLALLPILLTLALLAVPAAAGAQGLGVLEGVVVNGTAGASAPGAGLPVTLRVLRGESEVGTLTATTAAGGHFRFEGLDTAADLLYLPEVAYAGVSYGPAEPYQFGGAQGALLLAATLTVYETTDDDSGLSLSAVHLIAESFGQVLRITEVLLVSNSAGQTYIGRAAADGDPATVLVSLPAEAVGLAFDDEASAGSYREAPGGLAYTAPVPPGAETAALLFSYHLPVRGEVVALQRSFPYPVGDLSLLAAQPGLAVRSQALAAMGSQSFQGREYALYTAQGLAAGAPLALEFVPTAEEPAAAGLGPALPAEVGTESALPADAASGPTPTGHQDLLRWLGLALAGLALAGAVAYPLATRPQR